MSSKKIRKQDKSVSTFVSGWSKVIQNLLKSTYIDNKKAIAMPTNKETKLSLKDKLYQETLDEFARRQWNPESLKNDFKNWKEMTEIYPKKDRGWLIYQADIEKAVKLAIQKTYNALQAGKLTEAGQLLYDRRKDIEAHTANQIFAELKAAAWQQIEPDKLKQFYKEFSEAKDEKAALEIAQKFSIVGFSAEKFDAIKKKHGVLK